MKKLIVLTGAGISAESGISTFRDSGGLWEQYDVMKVASIEGWHEDPKLVLKFYNERRRQLHDVEPNEAHKILANLQDKFEVQVITQNVDNLHERAGSKNVMHLHGELTKARSSKDENLISEIGYNDINWGDKAADGSQLRPHIVWFGEAVPMITPATQLVLTADVFVVIGTSLNVYPAAGLVNYISERVPVYLIDPNEVNYCQGRNINLIQDKASSGTKKLEKILLEEYL